jgi:antitoxin (DNA-binding transcriptional repressor) of toxin-antitoxin stability system
MTGVDSTMYVTLEQAQAKLEELADLATEGLTIVITVDGEPKAAMVSERTYVELNKAAKEEFPDDPKCSCGARSPSLFQHERTCDLNDD